MLFVTDEVVTGFGRLGEYFCAEAVFGARPDVITCAKGLTSGYLPLSATLVSDEIHDVISVPQVPGGLLTHGFTYSGHPVVCAAALKVIEIMERDDICGHVREVGPYFEEQLTTLGRDPDGGRCPGQPHDPRGRVGSRSDDAAALRPLRGHQQADRWPRPGPRAR